MKKIWKVLIGLALVVPMVAYVAGSLVASAADDPAPRDTIQIRKTEPTSSATPSSRPTKTPTGTPDPTPSGSADDDDVEVITPDYDDFDDHDDHGDDDGEDHSGPGGGDDDGDDHDDNSGHGGED